MSRPLRIEYPDACYHVMNRAMTGHMSFLAEIDYESYLGLVEDAWRRWNIRVFAYCLMETHYHLALQTPQGNLQRIMRHIDGVYTQRFNRVHRRDGPLFRGRYKAILIDKETYLAAVVRYIHLNPVESGKTDDPMDYPWSSHLHYLIPRNAPPWLSAGELLSRYRTQSDFHEFVLSGNEETLMRFYSAKRHVPILGSNEFIARIKDSEVSFSSEHVGYETEIFRPPESSIVSEVARLYKVSEKSLFCRTRGKGNEPRQVAMYLVRELCDKSLKEIAEYFSLGSYGSVGRACSVIGRQIKIDRTLRQRIEYIRQIVSRNVAQKKT